MWTDINTLIVVMAVFNIVCVCLGFYLGRITQEKASVPSMPRMLPEKQAAPENDEYHDAMYGEEQKATPTVEDK